MTIDKNALEFAAIHWHKTLMGDMAMPWEQTGEGWKEDCRRQAREVIEAYERAKYTRIEGAGTFQSPIDGTIKSASELTEEQRKIWLRIA